MVFRYYIYERYVHKYCIVILCTPTILTNQPTSGKWPHCFFEMIGCGRGIKNRQWSLIFDNSVSTCTYLLYFTMEDRWKGNSHSFNDVYLFFLICFYVIFIFIFHGNVKG